MIVTRIEIKTPPTHVDAGSEVVSGRGFDSPRLHHLREGRMDKPISSTPDVMGGTPVFSGTRVPVQTLLDYLEAGDPLDAFLSDFPSVRKEHAVAVLELAKSALLANAVAA